ncbi:MAG: fatty acid desaturase [Rhodospirillaceae bacterium]|nr:fatty acid desaturase [Rhodospirillaceae bacterium]
MSHDKGTRPDLAEGTAAPRGGAVPPWRLNLVLAVAMAALNLVQLAALPLWLLPLDMRWGLLLIPIALTTPLLWSVLHEAIHGILHPLDAVNDGIGRGLAVLFGSPFRILRLGHLMHHRFNRTELDRTEVYAGPDAASPGARLIYYARLLAGLYLAEFAASAAALLPRRWVARFVALTFGAEDGDGRSMRRAAERHLLEPHAMRDLRLDGLAVVAVFALAFWFYGAAWWMLALALLGRAFLVSFLDNAYHYGTPPDDVLFSYNLALPRPVAAAAMLNFNFHAVHHRHPALPWTQLPRVFDESGDVHEGPMAAVALRQLRGPLPLSGLPAAARPRRLKTAITPT